MTDRVLILNLHTLDQACDGSCGDEGDGCANADADPGDADLLLPLCCWR